MTSHIGFYPKIELNKKTNLITFSAPFQGKLPQAMCILYKMTIDTF